MNPHPLTINEGTPLARVYRLYRALGIRHLPVTISVDETVILLHPPLHLVGVQ